MSLADGSDQQRGAPVTCFATFAGCLPPFHAQSEQSLHWLAPWASTSRLVLTINVQVLKSIGLREAPQWWPSPQQCYLADLVHNCNAVLVQPMAPMPSTPTHSCECVSLPGGWLLDALSAYSIYSGSYNTLVMPP